MMKLEFSKPSSWKILTMGILSVLPSSVAIIKEYKDLQSRIINNEGEGEQFFGFFESQVTWQSDELCIRDPTLYHPDLKHLSLSVEPTLSRCAWAEHCSCLLGAELWDQTCSIAHEIYASWTSWTTCCSMWVREGLSSCVEKINKMTENVMLLLPIYFNLATIFLGRTKSTCHFSLQNHHIIKHIAHSEDGGHSATALTQCSLLNAQNGLAWMSLGAS